MYVQRRMFARWCCPWYSGMLSMWLSGMKIDIPDLFISGVILLGGAYVVYDLFFKQQPPPVAHCLAWPLCGPGQIVDPLQCRCVNICPTPIISCGQGLRWNWCSQSCIPAASMIPDCNPPPCNSLINI